MKKLHRIITLLQSRFAHCARSQVEHTPRKSTAGFTLLEMVFAVEVLLLLTLIVFAETNRVREHAKVAACLSYHVALQRNLWGQYAMNGEFPNDIVPMLATMPKSAVDKNYSYSGGFDPDPLKSNPDGYYMRCNHDHSFVAVLFVDSGSYLPPKAIYNLATARGNL